jgi:carbon storage regulator
MLVLSRQRDETIMIGDEIELTVVDIRGDKVRIGIKAPADVPVHRKEVYDAIKKENEAAARLGRHDVPSLAGRNRARHALDGAPPPNGASRLSGANPPRREIA